MKIEDSRRLSDDQRRNIAQLDVLVRARNLKLTLNEEETDVLFLNEEGRLICSSPVTDFEDA